MTPCSMEGGNKNTFLFIVIHAYALIENYIRQHQQNAQYYYTE